jgi:hypothetical protein
MPDSPTQWQWYTLLRECTAGSLLRAARISDQRVAGNFPLAPPILASSVIADLRRALPGHNRGYLPA